MFFKKKSLGENQAFDIWTQWNYFSAIALKSIKKEINVFAASEEQFSIDMAEKHLKKFGISQNDDSTFQVDLLVQMLYFAVIRNKYNVRIFMPDAVEVYLEFSELKKYIPIIDYMSSILGVRTEAINVQKFVDDCKELTVYYSTPMGEDLNGNPKLYVLNTNESEHSFFPVFLSEEHALNFFKNDRSSFMVLSGTLEQCLTMLDSSEPLSEFGVVIEPENDCSIAIDPGIKVQK